MKQDKLRERLGTGSFFKQGFTEDESREGGRATELPRGFLSKIRLLTRTFKPRKQLPPQRRIKPEDAVGSRASLRSLIAPCSHPPASLQSPL